MIRASVANPYEYPLDFQALKAAAVAVLEGEGVREAKVTFVVAQGPPSRMGRVRFSGTEKIDIVYLQKRVPFEEGDRYAPAKVTALRDRLTSLGVFNSVPGLSAYNASKAALEAFGEALRYEAVPDGIFVSLIEPGTYATDSFFDKSPGIAVFRPDVRHADGGLGAGGRRVQERGDDGDAAGGEVRRTADSAGADDGSDRHAPVGEQDVHHGTAAAGSAENGRIFATAAGGARSGSDVNVALECESDKNVGSGAGSPDRRTSQRRQKCRLY